MLSSHHLLTLPGKDDSINNTTLLLVQKWNNTKKNLFDLIGFEPTSIFLPYQFHYAICILKTPYIRHALGKFWQSQNLNYLRVEILELKITSCWVWGVDLHCEWRFNIFLHPVFWKLHKSFFYLQFQWVIQISKKIFNKNVLYF